jgi:hypothetical protein
MVVKEVGKDKEKVVKVVTINRDKKFLYDKIFLLRTPYPLPLQFVNLKKY